MLSGEDWKFALEDARIRHEAVLTLILATDQQAMALLSLYVTLGSASASAFAVSIGQNAIAPSVLTLPMLGATIMFALGALKCFKAIETAMINLPGRKADFWLWAAREDIETAAAFRNYLENLQQMYTANLRVNQSGALALRYARQCGIAAPVTAVVIGVVVEGLKLI